MLGRNDTPFAAICFQQLHRNGNDMAVAAVRGSYLLDGDMQLDKDQNVLLVDEYEGEPQSSPLLKPADLIPFKPATDITVLADSYPPTDAGAKNGWLAGIRVDDYRYAVRIHGSRNWVRQGTKLVPGEAETPTAVPVDYRRSWGDLGIGEAAGDPAPFNPLGVRRPGGEAQSYPMAQIEQPQEDYSDPSTVRSFQGFAPIPPFWRDRQQFAGTYDDQWLKDRHPLLPEDFDYRFYQCAHPRLIAAGFLRGDETFELFRLSQRESIQFELPGLQPFARFIWNDDREVAMRLNLDGVHIDARSPAIRIDLTWRGWLPICPNFSRIDLACMAIEDPRSGAMPFSGLDGMEGINASGEVMA